MVRVGKGRVGAGLRLISCDGLCSLEVMAVIILVVVVVVVVVVMVVLYTPL